MQKIGRYQIEHELGRGAMGVVFRAYDPAIGRRVAVKTIRLDQLADPQAAGHLRERLLREAQSAGILSHPNIVTIYDIAEDAANAYIFMEYVEGATLESFARGIPVVDLLAILRQAASGLDYAHAKGIVHRDIKPGNLMLAGTRVKVTDFGVARLRHRDTTGSGTLLGTPSYMSPEQVAGGEVSGASDQFSLAVIAYEFLAGFKPFEHDNLATLLFKIAHEEACPIVEMEPPVNEVLCRALGKDPTKRFANCTAFVDALAVALGGAAADTPVRLVSGDEPTLITATPAPINVPVRQLPPPTRTPFDETPLPPPPSRRFVLPAVLLLVALSGAALWYFLRPRPDPEPIANNVPTEQATTKPSAAGEVVPAVPELKQNSEPAAIAEPVPPTTASQTSAPERGGKTYQISFTTNPESAEILVNDGSQDRCPRTPCALELPAGAFRITARLKDFSDVSRNVQVPDSPLVHIDFDRPGGMLVINSTPPGASIRLDGREILEKTPTMLKLKPATYKLEIIKDGLPAQSREVEIVNGTVQTLTVKWN